MSRTLVFLVLGICFGSASCASGVWTTARLLTIEPTANPPFAEAKLGTPYVTTFVDALPRALGVCIEGAPGATYSIDVATRGKTEHSTCEASASCGFSETCTLGPVETGSSVVVAGPAPARCLLHEAHEDESAGDFFRALGATLVFALGAVVSFVLAAYASRHRATEPAA